MRPVLRPGSVVLRRDRTCLQAGTAPRHAHLLRDAPGVVGLLRLLDGVRDLDLLRIDAAALTPDAPALVAELVGAGVVVDADAWDGVPPALRGEAAHLACRGVPADETRRRLASRAAAVVEISAAASMSDLARAVVDLLGRSGVPAETARVDSPTAVVVLTDRPIPRDPFWVLAHDGLTHLPVTLEQGRARIGPLVIPGLTPCVGCDDLTRQSADPGWTALVAQLDQPLVEPLAHGPDGLSAVTTAVVAAAIADEVVAHLDGSPAPTRGSVLWVGPDAQDLSREHVPFAPTCRCRRRTSRRDQARLAGPRQARAGTMGA